MACIAEENHYYAFGQKIAGICTKAFNKLPPNSFNYQGDYSEEEENTLWNEFDLRMYDPQIGRWTGADPYDEFASPYVGMGDDPVNNVDPDGGEINLGSGLWSTSFGWGLTGAVVGGAIEAFGGGDKAQAATGIVSGFLGGFGAYYLTA
ncbi:MAG TPA: RHS repeat-associated core domain-containing protein, partial [Puia sp.]|nr:RHS repeat-associated core domain-containing protein [Puia sp.]